MCFQSCQPRHRRLVEAVFPAPGETVDQAKLEHLTWYAQTEPRKLPKIGRNLAKRTTAAIARDRPRSVSTICPPQERGKDRGKRDVGG